MTFFSEKKFRRKAVTQKSDIFRISENEKGVVGGRESSIIK